MRMKTGLEVVGIMIFKGLIMRVYTTLPISAVIVEVEWISWLKRIMRLATSMEGRHKRDENGSVSNKTIGEDKTRKVINKIIRRRNHNEYCNILYFIIRYF